MLDKDQSCGGFSEYGEGCEFGLRNKPLKGVYDTETS
jgi:hypothetical protein